MNAPSVTVDGEKKVFPYRKVEGLFYYICVKKRITRDEAIGVFWADCEEAGARKNLRDALYHIKKMIGHDMIQMEGNVFISVNPKIRLIVDTDGVKEHILERYEGEFLNFFYIKNCLEFEMWMEDYRRELRELYIRETESEIQSAIEKGDADTAVFYSGKLLDQLHLDEEFYRKVLKFLIQEAEYSRAIRLYQRLTEVLKKDLEEEPEEETKALLEKLLKIRKKTIEKSDREHHCFFGRQKELYEIYDNVQGHQVKKNGFTANFTLVLGEAGVGKTALLNHIKKILEKENYTIFSYSCCSSESDLYLKPWNNLLNQIQEFFKSRKTEPLQGKNGFLNEITDYRLFVTQYEIHFEELLRSLSQTLKGAGIVLFLDDIQWMDSSSIQLLHNLLFHLRDCKLSVIAACRSGQIKEISNLKVSLMRESLLQEVKVKRFTLDETREFIGAFSEEILDKPGNAEKIFHYTDGNALFLTELLMVLKENKGQAIETDKLLSRTAGIIQGRLMNLPREEMDVLDIISVFPNEITMEDIKILSQEPEFLLFERLEHLLERQIIIEKTDSVEITYQFTHVLIRNYIQSHISAGRRQSYHKKAARYYEEKYERTEDINLMPVLIYHFEHAKDTYKKYTYKLEYIKRFFAGKQEIYPVMSANFSDNFFLPGLEKEDHFLIPLAKEIRALPEKNEGYQDLKMKMEYLIGRYDLSSGDYKKGLKNINNCLTIAQYLGDKEYLMDGYLQMIYYAIQVYDLEMMKKYIGLGESLLKQFRYPKSAFYAVLRLKALYFIKKENYQDAAQILDWLIPKMEKLLMTENSLIFGLAACYNYRGEIYMYDEEWEEALLYISKAVSSCHFEPPTAGLGMSYTNMGILLYQMARYDKASEYFEKARMCFQNISIQWGRTREEAYSALLDLKLGKTKSALHHYAAACRYAGKDYSPYTTAILQEVYNQLIKLPGEKPKYFPIFKKNGELYA